MPNSVVEIVCRLKSMRNPKNVAGMARFGINPENTLGVSIPVLRRMAAEIGKNHALALELWDSGIHEARLLAGFIDDPAQVGGAQMEEWAAEFDSWDVCDQVCSSLFDRTPLAYHKALEWSARKEEFVKRAGFVLMAALAVHDKKAGDAKFMPFFPIIVRESCDGRNFVKKAVNWALRQIGKSRNMRLNRAAIAAARKIAAIDSPSAKWIASDALRELSSPSVRKRLAVRR
ncbi:MAG: DNA alkylation repair protein [Candidatus Micrarchaeota archaeon]